MQFVYRGVAYQYNNPPYFKMTEIKSVGRYRGTTWRSQELKEVPISQPALLKYRGVAYSTGSAPEASSK